MGDRINIGFRNGEREDEPIVFLYSHWGGELADRWIKQALKKSASRWDDYGYATRIAISTIIGEDWQETTGFGIYVDQLGAIPDRPTVIIDWKNRNITWYYTEDVREMKKAKYDLLHSFANFINPEVNFGEDLEDPRISEYNR